MKNILIVCNMGVSSRLLQESIEKTEKAVDVSISSIAEVDDKMAESDVDIILVTPQIGFLKETYDRKFGDEAVVMLIDDADFVNLDGETILNKALQEKQA